MNNKRMEQNQQAVPAMEAFEQRLLLAGNVLAEVTNAGDLIITGDDAANQIIITEVDGTVTITRDDGDTSINGDADIPGTGVELDGIFSRNIKIKMGDGDDVVTIEGDEGDNPNDPADDNRFEIGGNVQIDLGNGTTEDPEFDQAVILNLADVAGSVKITSKDANDANAAIVDSTIGKNTQIALGGGNNIANIVDSTIGGNLKIANKDGDQIVLVARSTVDGSVSIANGKGKHSVQIIQSTTIGKNLSIKNKQLVTAEGELDPDQNISINNTTVSGSMKISNGKGAADISVGGSTTVAKKLSISSKDGDDDVELSSVTAAGVKISTGKGAADVSIDDVTTDSLAVANKDGATDIEIDDTTVTKKTKLTGGKAETIVNINTMTATGGLQIKGGGKAVGDGALEVDILGLTGGEKAKVNITGGGDADIINIDDVTLASLQIKTGKGNDLINIERAGELFADDGVISTVGSLKLDAGAGDDIIEIGTADAARALTLTGKTSVKGGKGNDTLNADPITRGNIIPTNSLKGRGIEVNDLGLNLE